MNAPNPRLPRTPVRTHAVCLLSLALLAAGCVDDTVDDAPLAGVDFENRVVTIGALNDESGPGAAIGRQYAIGKRILAEQVNAGGSGLLPEGWTIRMVERDHGYNPQRSVQAYNEIRDQVLFIAHSFGTPNTLPLQPMLERDRLVAFPASLSSKMAEHPYTPPAGPAYSIEAMRAMDWAVEQAGGAAEVRAGIVYQQDDYGQDGLDGWRHAAQFHGVRIVSEQAVAPGQTDMTAVISALRAANANYVLITTLPSSTGPVLGTAAQLGYMPVWIGNLPAWIDRFFEPQVIPPQVFANFYWVMGLPFWGEDVPGMDRFLEAARRFGGPDLQPDFYILTSYIQGLGALEAFRRMAEGDDRSRRGYLDAIRSLDNWNAGGLVQPVSFARFPYVTSIETRVLRPVMAERRWEVVAPYAAPRSFQLPGG
jgi:ABC-type branched-subunit amino acid transport system substrate-binding protein